MNPSKQETTWIALASSGWDGNLVDFGERIANLLKSKKTQRNDFAIATLDDLLGAVYALILSLHNKPPFKHRPHKIDPRVLLKRARTIGQAHRIRTNGKWLAGFHFNSAMFRLSSVYHRSLKIVADQPESRKTVGREEDPKSLIQSAKRTYKRFTHEPWNNDNIAKIHTEVNHLKHTATGIYWGRNVNERQAIMAVKELLTLLEVWDSQI